MAKRYIEVDEEEERKPQKSGGWGLLEWGAIIVAVILVVGALGDKNKVNAEPAAPTPPPPVQVHTNVDVAPAEVYVQPAEVIVNVPVQQEPVVAAPVNAMPSMSGAIDQAQTQAPMLTSEQILSMCWAWVDSPDIGWFADWDEARPECGQTPIGSPITQPPSR